MKQIVVILDITKDKVIFNLHVCYQARHKTSFDFSLLSLVLNYSNTKTEGVICGRWSRCDTVFSWLHNAKFTSQCCTAYLYRFKFCQSLTNVLKLPTFSFASERKYIKPFAPFSMLHRELYQKPASSVFLFLVDSLCEMLKVPEDFEMEFC